MSQCWDSSFNNQRITQRNATQLEAAAIFSFSIAITQVLSMVFVKYKNSLWHIYIFTSSLRTEKPGAVTRHGPKQLWGSHREQTKCLCRAGCAWVTHHGAYLDPIPHGDCLWCQLQILIWLSPSSGLGGTEHRILRAALRQNIRVSV